MQYYGEIKNPYMTIWMNITDKIRKQSQTKKAHTNGTCTVCTL